MLTFGLVSVPVKMYSAAVSNSVKFSQLTPAGNRVKQFLRDATTGEEVSRSDLSKGFEVAKGEFVVFTPEEVKALSVESDRVLEIEEFVDESSIDLAAVEKSYYLGPDKGGDKGYALLSAAMKGSGRVAVSSWTSRGKEHLVAVCPYKGGLIMHQLFYGSEV